MGFIICRMQMIWEDSVKTMGVTIQECVIQCYYAAPWVNTLTLEEVMSVLEHEALHILNHHMSRQASRQKEAWNVACDMAINCLIKTKLPVEGCFAPPEWQDKAAEWIYDQLPREDGEGGGGEGEGEGEGEGTGEGEDGNGKDNKGKDGKGKGQGDEGDLNETYGKYGKPMDNHDIWKNADHAGLAGLVVKQLVQEAIARNKGDIPGQYQALVEKILRSKVDWRQLLRYYVSSRIRANRKLSYKHRDRRRMTVSNFVFPGHVRREGLELIVVADTSGSMFTKDQMEQFFTELEGIIRQTSAVTRVIQIDAEVHSDEMYKSGDWRKIKIVGGGGTDFRPAFAHIEKKKYNPCVVVFFTDGCGDYPDAGSVPKYQVLWTMVTDVKAPFGKTIKLDLD